jgi:hypothetical protein
MNPRTNPIPNPNRTPLVDLYFDRPRRRVGFANVFASAVVAMSAAVSVAGAATPSRARD